MFLTGMVVLLAIGPARASEFDKQNCLDAPYESAASPKQIHLSNLVGDLRAVLEDFPSLVLTLNKQAPQICLSDQLFAEKAYLSTEENRIVLASEMTAGLMLAVLVHEIRHAEQMARGICPSDDLAMAQYARATFSLEADATVVSLLVAMQQKVQGNPSLWHALEEWPMTTDIARRFEAAMNETQDVSVAAAAAFEQWYASDARRDLYYVAVCSDYLERQERAHALPRYLDLPPDYFSRLCLMPNGREYECEEPQNALDR